VTEIAVRIEGLGKQFQIGGLQQPRTLAELVSTVFDGLRLNHGARRADPPTVWALRDVSFDVRRGEALAVIGRNGAGKSTLLKILSRITEPSEGRAELIGRVGSLLEVGTGFHGDLSGRENVFLNGAILGMRRAEIARKFDEIVAFADVERFIDTPVKHYSTGMYMRLAFAVAAHLEPDILVVDEVLAVGDAAFQKKCLGKMNEVARAGRTVLFVSHNMAAVRSLCTRAVHLASGRVESVGTASDVVAAYLAGVSGARPERTWAYENNAPGDERSRLRVVRVVDAAGNVSGRISSDDALEIQIEFSNDMDGSIVGTTLMIFAADGTCIFSSLDNKDSTSYSVPRRRGLWRSTCSIPGQLLSEGSYSVSIAIWSSSYSPIVRVDDVVVFEIYDGGGVRGDYFGGFAGVVRPLLKWSSDWIGPAPVTSEIFPLPQRKNEELPISPSSPARRR
jgi:lipopolysaccharide transport system ATP-binding protein